MRIPILPETLPRHHLTGYRSHLRISRMPRYRRGRSHRRCGPQGGDPLCPLLRRLPRLRRRQADDEMVGCVHRRVCPRRAEARLLEAQPLAYEGRLRLPGIQNLPGKDPAAQIDGQAHPPQDGRHTADRGRSRGARRGSAAEHARIRRERRRGASARADAQPRRRDETHGAPK